MDIGIDFIIEPEWTVEAPDIQPEARGSLAEARKLIPALMPTEEREKRQRRRNTGCLLAAPRQKVEKES